MPVSDMGLSVKELRIEYSTERYNCRCMGGGVRRCPLKPTDTVGEGRAKCMCNISFLS